MADSPSLSQEQRRRLVAMAVALTVGPPRGPALYECELLQRCKGGELSLDQFSDLMDQRVYQLLYHSRPARPLGETELMGLLTWARAYNAAHGITGLLLYSDGYFVQVLEGDEAAINAVYSRIQQDPRHEEVVTVHEGLGPRRFGDWSMGFGFVNHGEMQRTLDAIEAQWPFRVPSISDPQLLALLEAFS